MRKLATHVPEIISRLQRASIGASSPPVWLSAVTSNPPPIQPSRSTVARTQRVAPKKGSAQSHSVEQPLYDDLFPRKWNASAEGETSTHKSKHFRAPHPRPQAIVYEEDRIRRQFFRDFPYEAFRPTSLVEGREVKEDDGLVKGKDWTFLWQRGLYPTVEDTIAFVLNLHNAHQKTMTEAYFWATQQFIELRAAHEQATIAAEAEARAHGATFAVSPFARLRAKEAESLSTLDHLSASSSSTSTSTVKTSNKYRKPARWTASAPGGTALGGPHAEGAELGQGYMEGWKLPPALAVPPTQAAQAEGDVEASAEGGKAAQQTQGEQVPIMQDDDAFSESVVAQYLRK